MSKSTTPVPEYGTTGVFEGISIEDYHAGHGVSNSGLTLLAQSPYLYYAKKLDPKRPAEPSRAGQLEGNLLHCAFLEPNEFSARYVCTPADAPKRPSVTQLNAKKPSPETVAAIDWWENFGNEHAGKTVITADQYTVAWKQADSLRTISDLRTAMSRGHAERSAYWTDPVTGVYCRCRPDWEYQPNDTTSILIDAKTCGNASGEEFAAQIARKRYHVQDPFYSEGFAAASGRKVAGFIFAAVESTYPYAPNAVMLDQPSRDRGYELMRRDLATLRACQESGEWAGYMPTGNIQPVSLPKWAMGAA